jgi:hypothetical protein
MHMAADVSGMHIPSIVARLLTAHVLWEQLPHQILTVSIQNQNKAPGLQSKPNHRL